MLQRGRLGHVEGSPPPPGEIRPSLTQSSCRPERAPPTAAPPPPACGIKCKSPGSQRHESEASLLLPGLLFIDLPPVQQIDGHKRISELEPGFLSLTASDSPLLAILPASMTCTFLDFSRTTSSY